MNFKITTAPDSDSVIKSNAIFCPIIVTSTVLRYLRTITGLEHFVLITKKITKD
jgi:hypothetical protein